MIKRKKQFNSTLFNISKKREKEGTYKGIRKSSKKADSLWKEARAECIKRWGHRDALTLKPFLEDDTVVVHHYCYTRAQAPGKKYDQLNLCPMKAEVHNRHSGADGLFHQWKPIIINNAKLINLETYED